MVDWQEGVASWRAMASPIQLVVADLEAGAASARAEAVAADIEASEAAMSRFRADAELVRLNERPAEWIRVSTRLYAGLAAAYRAFRETNGRFDPRILAHLETLGYAGAPRVAKARPQAQGAPWLGRDPRGRRVRTFEPLDLGGIGKGLAVRWGARVAARRSHNFLLDAGGDLVAVGSGPDGSGWQIGVEDPMRPERLVAALRLRAGGAVCTSSIGRRRWRHDGRTVHHLIDPATGEPGGQGLLAVTVIGPDPAWAEVWSKALFLRGARDIAAAARGRAVLWVAEGGGIGLTPEADRLVFWRAPGTAEPAARSGLGLPGAFTAAPATVFAGSTEWGWGAAVGAADRFR